MEPLYKGQVGWVLCLYTVEPLYKGQVGDGSFVSIQWSLSTRDKLGMGPLYRGASLQGMVLSSSESHYQGNRSSMEIQ